MKDFSKRQTSARLTADVIVTTHFQILIIFTMFENLQLGWTNAKVWKFLTGSQIIWKYRAVRGIVASTKSVANGEREIFGYFCILRKTPDVFFDADSE